MRNALHVRKIDETTRTVYLPVTYAANENKESLYLAFSTKYVQCQAIYQRDTVEAKISSDLWDELGLPYEQQIHVYREKETLHIGPLIGLFTAGFTGDPKRPLGQRTRMFADYLSISAEIGAFCYVFGAHHIHWERATVTGFFYQNGTWEQREVPLPDVIYDRLPNRQTEQLKQIRQAKQRLQNDYLIPWFNPGFFDKCHIQKILQADERTAHYLPETHLKPALDQLQAMLDKHHRVFLKPAGGSQGIGIHEIEKNQEGYSCRFHNGENNRLREFATLHDLVKQQLPEDSTGNLLAQSGVGLMQRGGRSFDFRLHANKNTKDEWEVSAIGAKISGPESVTTHAKYGGEIKTAEDVLQNIEDRQDIMDELRRAVLAISTVIDENTKDIVAEIGCDLGVDRQGRVWLFEANAKPGRHIFAHPKLKEMDLATRKLPLTYAVHLAEEAMIRPELVYG